MSRLLPLLATLAGVIVLDQLTKRWALAALWPPPSRQVVVPGLLEWAAVENRGVAFGLFGGAGLWLALGVLLLLLAWAMRAWRELLAAPLAMRLALGLIGGGGVGNLIDRSYLGFVVDFIHLPALSIFQVFNVADVAITGGGTGLVLAMLGADLRERRAARRASAEPAEPEGG